MSARSELFGNLIIVTSQTKLAFHEDVEEKKLGGFSISRGRGEAGRRQLLASCMRNSGCASKRFQHNNGYSLQ